MAEITSKEIAARLGLSPSAVSLALNGKPGVSRKTRDLVLEEAAKLGYALPQKSLPVGPKKKTICYMIYVDQVVSIAEHTSFSSFVLHGIESAASSLGYATQIRYYNADEPYELKTSGIFDEVDGIILLGTDITENRAKDMNAFLDVAGTMPMVIVDNFMFADRVDCVGNDNFGGAQSAVLYLLSRGCRRIGYLRSRQRIKNFDEREAGIKAALSKHGLELATVIDVGVSSEGAFYDLGQWLDTGAELPEAFFAENDVVACAAIRTLKMHGVNVPEDISVIGFDDIPLCEMLDPQVSTIHSYIEQLGIAAVNALHLRLQQYSSRSDFGGRMKISVSTDIIPRKSVR